VVEGMRIFDPQRSSHGRGISNPRELVKSVDLTLNACARKYRRPNHCRCDYGSAHPQRPSNPSERRLHEKKTQS
jgi:hypothetical protein